MKRSEDTDFVLTVEQTSRLKEALRQSDTALYEAIFSFYIAMSQYDKLGNPLVSTLEDQRIIESQAEDIAQVAVQTLQAAFEEKIPHTAAQLRRQLQDALGNFTLAVASRQFVKDEQPIHAAVIKHLTQLCSDTYYGIIYSPAQQPEQGVAWVH